MGDDARSGKGRGDSVSREIQSTKGPLVSVIMSVYRPAVHLLNRSVESILAQTYPKFEFIIVDDGNSEEDRTLLARCSQQDDRIRIIRNDHNIGLTKSLRRATENARGTLIARQDADDFSKPERLQVQVERFGADVGLGLLGTWYLVIDGDETKCLKHANDTDSLSRELMRSNPFCHASTMFPKAVCEEVGGYDVRYRTSQDLDLWFRIAEAGYSLGMVESFLVERSLHEDSLSLSRRAWYQVANSFRIRLRYCGQYGLSAYARLLKTTVWHASSTLLPNGVLKLMSRLRGTGSSRV